MRRCLKCSGGAAQWLCNADTSAADPRKRLLIFFTTLYACLTRGGRAVLQLYPENTAQAEVCSGRCSTRPLLFLQSHCASWMPYLRLFVVV